jgi:hypothetical protein
MFRERLTAVMFTETACRWVIIAPALSLCGVLHSAFAADAKPDKTIAKHLDSIGTAGLRTSVESRVVQGTLPFRISAGGTGGAAGSWGRVSEQRKSRFVMRFITGDWRGEQFIFDGDKASFAAATASHLRSSLAQFVAGHDFIVKEGWLGGELRFAPMIVADDRSGHLASPHRRKAGCRHGHGPIRPRT